MTTRTFRTGSKRDTNANKPPLSKLMWTALEEVAFVHQYGDEEYGEGNWRKGQPLKSTIESAIRHLKAVLKGEDKDPKSGYLHSAHAEWNCGLITHQLKHAEHYAELDDRMDDFGNWVNPKFAETEEAKKREKGKE